MTYRPHEDAAGRPPSAAATLAVVLTGATLVSLAALHVLSPEFDPSWRMVSEYALGRNGLLLSVMFACWGISTWALVVALWPELTTRRGRIGLAFLVLAGIGEAMASIFDITQDVPHGIAGLLGIGCFPIAALLISAALPRDTHWGPARRPLIALAGLSWLGLASLVATLVVMTAQVAQAYGGHLPSAAPASLPPGVLRLDGWADRLIVVANCLWVAAAAWRARVSRTRVVEPSRVLRRDEGRTGISPVEQPQS